MLVDVVQASEIVQHERARSAQLWPKAERLRSLALAAYWAAKTPLEAKMAGILLDMFGDGRNDYDEDIAGPVHRLFAEMASATATRPVRG